MSEPTVAEEPQVVKTREEQAREDAERVSVFLIRQRDHWSKQADARLRDGSMDGAMQCHEYAEACASAANKVAAFNGLAGGYPPYPCVLLSECGPEPEEVPS